jgi:hypothetical protein
MEPRFHKRPHNHFRHHLRNAIRHRRYPQRTHLPIPLGYLYQSHRRREITPRRHPVPDLVQVSLEAFLEHRQRFSIHPGRATVGSHQPPRRHDKLFGKTIRLRLRPGLLPLQVDPFPRPDGSAPSLHPHYRVSSLLQADPPLRSTSGL